MPRNVLTFELLSKVTVPACKHKQPSIIVHNFKDWPA